MHDETQAISLRDLERKAWSTVYVDGLWDIFLGLLLMSMAVGTVLDELGLTERQSMGVYVALVILAMAILWLGKRFVTVPRMGRFKPGPRGKARSRTVSVILLLSVVVGLVAFAITLNAASGQKPVWLNPTILIPTIWAVNMLLVFGLAAAFLNYQRLYVVAVMYAIALPLAAAADQLFDVKLGFWAFGLPAAVILIMGCVVFARFLRDNPPLPKGERLAQGAVDGERQTGKR